MSDMLCASIYNSTPCLRPARHTGNHVNAFEEWENSATMSDHCKTCNDHGCDCQPASGKGWLRQRAEEAARECCETEAEIQAIMTVARAFAERALKSLMGHPCVVWSGQPSEEFRAEAIAEADRPEGEP